MTPPSSVQHYPLPHLPLSQLARPLQPALVQVGVWGEQAECGGQDDSDHPPTPNHVYSVGPVCMNLSTQQLMEDYTIEQSEADTILFNVYDGLRQSGYSGPVVIDAADTDVYVAASVISRQLPGMLCIRRNKETVLCRDLLTEEMAECIVQLHCFTGCDANSGFYGKGKSSVYEKVAKSSGARQQLSRCGDSLHLEEEVVQELFAFTRQVIYGDKKSSTMAEARASKWKAMKRKSFIRLPPDADSLRQHCLRANYLAYLVRHPTLKDHPSPLRHGWELAGILGGTWGLNLF